MDKLLSPSAIAELIGCKVETARKLMREMPLVNLSPVGCIRPRYAVKESDFKNWMHRRTMTTDVRTVKQHANIAWGKLEYRR